ncbi:MAG: M56 family metallopeptidase, partial [Planctomycetota bacterium]
MSIDSLLSLPLLERIGWTLLHSLWQLSLVAVLAASVLLMLRKASASARYTLALAMLFVMAALPAVTFVLLGDAVTPIDTSAHPAPATPVATVPVPSYETDAPSGAARPALSDVPVVSASPRPADVSARLKALFEPFAPYCAVFWFLGVIVLSARLAGGWLHLQTLKTKASPVEAALCARFASLAARLRVTRPVRLLEAAIDGSPLVVGWFKPVILVPPAALLNLSAGQLEAILLHELAHIRRWDHFANAVQTVIETLLFYHPGARWLSRRIRAEREHCADDLAAASTGDALLYARALAALEESRAKRGLALAARRGSLLSRIQRLFKGPASHAQPRRWFSALLALAVISITTAFLLPAVSAEKEQSEAAGGLSLEFEVQADFPFDRSTVTVWRALKDDEPLPDIESLDDWNITHWRDPATGRTFVPIGNYNNSKYRIEDLGPGPYVMTAALETAVGDMPRIVAAREDFVLDGSRERTKITLAATDTPGIALNVTDVTTGEPLHARVVLFAEDG